MHIIDMETQYEQTYLNCLEDWSEEMKEAGNHRANWFGVMKDKGLRVKLAKDDLGQIVGMIQYLPAELSFVEQGEGYYMILCIWVHGYNEGVGKQQKKGIGSLLLDAALEDARALGAAGMLAWGISMPFWMRASWFKKHEFKSIDKDGTAVLLIKEFEVGRELPKLVRMKKKPPKGEVRPQIMVFKNGWCSASNIVLERTFKALKDFEGQVDVEIIDTLDREKYLEWGIYDGVYIDGKVAQKGPPPSYEKLHHMIEKAVKHYR